MSAMHPKATETSLRISCRDGPLADVGPDFASYALSVRTDARLISAWALKAKPCHDRELET